MSPLKYLMQELKFSAKEWSALGETDKDTLKQWARDEMTALGVVFGG